MPPKAKKTSNKDCAARVSPLPSPAKRMAAARVGLPDQQDSPLPSREMEEETPRVKSISASTLLSTPRQSLPPLSSSIPHDPSDQSNTEIGSARCRPFRANSLRSSIPQIVESPPSPLTLPPSGYRYRPLSLNRIRRSAREIKIIAPSLDPAEPIRLPDPPHVPPSIPPSSDLVHGASQETPVPAVIEKEKGDVEVDQVKVPIKLREGWGYKLGQTKWRAVYDPKRKDIPKLPLRGPGGYSVESTGIEGTSTNNTPICLFVNPHQESRDTMTTPIEKTPKSNSSKKTWPRPKTIRDYNQEKDEDAARVVKKCYDERMEEEASSTSPSLGALIKILTEEETAQPPQEHGYTFPKCTQTAEIVTTFPLTEVAHYQRKKYKDDHVVINTSDLDEIYTTVKKMRTNKRKWAQVKARAAVDLEFKEKQVAKKARAYANEKAKIAAMSKEERKLMNKRKYVSEKYKKLEKDPEQLAKQRRKEERRKATLERDKARLVAGVDNPEERRRLQRKIRAAERTPEEKQAISKRDAEYNLKKRTLMKNASTEELAKREEKNRLKEEKKAALAKLSPKERVRAQQREYEARHKAKKRARIEEGASFRGESISPSKRSPQKRRGENEVYREEEIDLMDGGGDDYGFGDEGGKLDESQMAVESISSPSHSHQSRHVTPHHSHSHSYSHLHHDDMMGMDGPSTSRHHQQRYDGDIETEIIQLQKDVVWSERAIHNSRVEVDRLRQEASSLETAIEEELETQMERKRRIARLTAIWREDHGEDSQG